MHKSLRRVLMAAGLAAAGAVPLLALGGFAAAQSGSPTGSPTASATASTTATSTAAPSATLQLQAGGGESGIAVELFFPNSVTVQTGTTVTWKNPFGEPHTVTFGNPTGDPTVPQGVADSGPTQYDGTGFISSGLFAPGFQNGPGPATPDTFSVQFTKAGQYSYFCAIHTKMGGSITVVDSGTVDTQAGIDPQIQSQYATALASLKALEGQQPTAPTVTTNADGTKTYTVQTGADNDDGDLNQFFPATVNISTGDTVHWTIDTITPHTVTFNPDQFQGDPLHTPRSGGTTYDGGSGLVNSGIIAPADDPLSAAFTSSGTDYSLTFTKAGNYQYICLLHADEGMHGAVNVSQATNPSPTPTKTSTGGAPQPPNTGTGTASSSGNSLWMGLGLLAALFVLSGAGVVAVKRHN